MRFKSLWTPITSSYAFGVCTWLIYKISCMVEPNWTNEHELFQFNLHLIMKSDFKLHQNICLHYLSNKIYNKKGKLTYIWHMSEAGIFSSPAWTLSVVVNVVNFLRFHLLLQNQSNLQKASLHEEESTICTVHMKDHALFQGGIMMK